MPDKYWLEKPANIESKNAEAINLQDANARIFKAQDLSIPVQSTDALSNDTRVALDKQGQLNAPLDGDVGESTAKAALEHQPGVLKNADGSDKVIKGVADGQYDSKHGIDLVAADANGKPVVVEVKERKDKPAELDDDPLTSIETKDGSPVKQMDDKWVQDRWRKLIADPTRRSELYAAGVKPQYLNPQNFSSDSAKLWSDVLSDKAVIVVSPLGEKAISPKLIEQCNQRGIKQIKPIKV